MQLKIKNYILVLFLLSQIILKAQEKRIKLQGTVKYDSIALQDVNIINKATKQGASSDKNGHFIIYATKGDSILISSIVYKKRIIVISETHLNTKKIAVYLEPNYNLLNEVMLTKKFNTDWGNVPVTKGTILNNDNITGSKPPNARRLTDPNAKFKGADFITILGMITKKLRSKSNKRKSEQKRIQQLKDNLSTTIKNQYGENFFTEWLHIPKGKINLFLDYCVGNGLGNFYNSDEIIIKNFLIKQAREFNSFKN